MLCSSIDRGRAFAHRSSDVIVRRATHTETYRERKKALNKHLRLKSINARVRQKVKYIRTRLVAIIIFQIRVENTIYKVQLRKFTEIWIKQSSSFETQTVAGRSKQDSTGPKGTKDTSFTRKTRIRSQSSQGLYFCLRSLPAPPIENRRAESRGADRSHHLPFLLTIARVLG